MTVSIQCFMIDIIYLTNSFPVLCVSSHMPLLDIFNTGFLGVWTHELICLPLYHFPKRYWAVAANCCLKMIGCIQLKFEGLTHKVFFFLNIQSILLSRTQSLTPSLLHDIPQQPICPKIIRSHSNLCILSSSLFFFSSWSVVKATGDIYLNSLQILLLVSCTLHSHHTILEYTENKKF